METNRQIPAWMQEASVKDIPRKKLEFLQKLVFESKSLSQKELLPFLMALFRGGNNGYRGRDPQIQHARGAS